MNQFLNDHLFYIVIALLLVILLLIGALVAIIFKLISQKQSQKPETLSNNISTQLTQTEIQSKLKDVVTEKFYCSNHPDQPSVGGCLICEDVFCEKCLIEHDGMFFCREHFKIFANHKWVQITDVLTTPSTPEEGQYIWDYKRFIWKEKQTPSFVLTHYKINVDNDFIESYVQLNVREEDKEKLINEVENYKAKH
jgi:hypothetical protein